jgi:hypothetical protein
MGFAMQSNVALDVDWSSSDDRPPPGRWIENVALKKGGETIPIYCFSFNSQALLSFHTTHLRRGTNIGELWVRYVVFHPSPNGDFYTLNIWDVHSAAPAMIDLIKREDGGLEPEK